MDSTQVATLIGVGIAVVTGILGIIYGALGQHTAKLANEAAQDANRIAASAAESAQLANGLANDANKLSEEANALVKRTVSRDEENWFVEWDCEWNAPSAILVLKHRGKDPALETTVVVSGPVLYHSGSVGDVPAGTDATVELFQVIQQRGEYDRQAEISFREMSNAGYIFARGSFSEEVGVTLIWRTGLGTVRTQRRELVLT